MGFVGLLTCPPVPFRRFLHLARPLIVFGNQPGVLAGALAAALHQPRRRPRVIDAPQALEHRLVGHLAQQRVLKEVLPRPRKRRRSAPEYEFPATQRLQGGADAWRFTLGAQGPHRLVPEDAPHHRRPLQGRPVGLWQTVQPRLQHPGQRRRHANRHQARRVHLPRFRARDDAPLVNQHLDQFFGVERVAFRAAHHQVAQGGRHLGHPLQDLGHELPAGAPGERQQVEPRMGLVPLAPLRAALVEWGAGEGKDQQRQVVAPLHQVGDGVERVVVGPVQVFEQEHRRVGGADGGEELHQIVQRPVVDLLGVVENAAQVRAGGEIQPDEMPDEMRLFHRVRVGVHELDDAALQFLARQGRRVAV